jgi:hypothetical protein
MACAGGDVAGYDRYDSGVASARDLAPSGSCKCVAFREYAHEDCCRLSALLLISGRPVIGREPVDTSQVTVATLKNGRAFVADHRKAMQRE